MCVGIPMQVRHSQGLVAQCSGRQGSCQIDLTLVGPQPEGTWLLTFLNAAREVLEPAVAGQIDAALDALEAVARGETDLDAYFSDLTAREPQLPEHLQALRTSPLAPTLESRHPLFRDSSGK